MRAASTRTAVAPAGAPPSCAGRGFTLVELLVATVVAGIALAGAWAWLWSMAPPAWSLQSGAQGASAAAYALREIEGELRDAVALYTPTACAPDCGLLLEHRHPGTAPETVPIVWDASRQVLWRKTSSTYLADHVVRFTVDLVDAAGAPVTAGEPGARLTGAVRVRVALEVAAGAGVQGAQADLAVRLP